MALPVKKLNEKFEGQFEFKRRNVSVPFALPGDLVQFQVLRRGRKQKIKVLFIERNEPPDPEIPLAEPFCRHFGTCGGCRGQHLDYAYQLKLKTGPVIQKFQSEFNVLPRVIGAPLKQGHRNRMDFAVSGMNMGLRPPGDFETILDLQQCPVLRESGQKVFETIRSVFEQYRPVEGLNYVVIRAGSAGGCVILNTGQLSESLQSFIQELTAKLPDSFSVVECKQAESDISVTPSGRVLKGRAEFTDRLGGVDFQVPYDSFFQPAPDCFDLLIESALSSLEKNTDLADADSFSLTDLFCGAGVLSRILAGRFRNLKSVTGHEFTESAVQIARSQFDAPGFENIQTNFHCTDLNKPPEDLFINSSGLLLADPPRPGLGPSLAAKIAREKPARYFLYISCNPYSMLKDLSVLKDSYEILETVITDCYPQTPHLEQFVLLRSK